MNINSSCLHTFAPHTHVSTIGNCASGSEILFGGRTPTRVPSPPFRSSVSTRTARGKPGSSNSSLSNRTVTTSEGHPHRKPPPVAMAAAMVASPAEAPMAAPAGPGPTGRILTWGIAQTTPPLPPPAPLRACVLEDCLRRLRTLNLTYKKDKSAYQWFLRCVRCAFTLPLKFSSS